MLPYIKLFNLDIPTYWLCGLCGLCFAALCAWRQNKRYKLPRADIFYMSLYALIGALIGAKALYIVTILRYITSLETFIEALSQGGAVFYGGLLGGIGMGIIYLKKYKLDIGAYADFAAPLIPLFHAFGRIGCFLAGCCWGMEVSWGVCYSNSLAAPNGVPLLPIQLIEAALLLTLFMILYVLGQRKTDHSGAPLMRLYIFIYAVMRFILEFFRGDAIRGVFILSTSQWVSLALIATLIGMEIKNHSART